MGKAEGERAGRGWIRSWKVWELPKRALGYVLAVEVAAVLTVVAAVIASRHQAHHWELAVGLAGTAIVHLHASWRVEKQRRDHSHTPHVDLASIWIFPAALVLPPALAVSVLLVVYGHRWWLVGRFDASRPFYRNVFTTSMMTLTVLSVVFTSNILGLPTLIADPARNGVLLFAVVAAGLTSWLVNTVLLAGVLCLTTSFKRWRDVLGSASDNLLELSQLVLGAITALMLLTWPALIFLMVVPAVAIHNTVLLHQYRLAARTDGKTGLINATTWQDQLGRELARARQEGTMLAVLMLDLDYFKRVNDTHGHLVGDDVLKKVAVLLGATVRGSDAVGRLGGEEFGVLLPGASPDAAVDVAERIRQRTAAISVPVGDGKYLTGVTVSIGIACYPQVAEDTPAGLISAADSALYAAKAQGRNRVMRSGDHRTHRLLPTARDHHELLASEVPGDDRATA